MNRRIRLAQATLQSRLSLCESTSGMSRRARLATAILTAVAALALLSVRGFSPSSRADDTATQTIPAPLAPLEYLLGRWNGRGVFKDGSAKRFRGWDEKHSWAWIFVKGEPVGLAVTIEGGKVLAAGKLTFDPARKLYRLEGTEPKPGGPIVLEGTIDKSSKHLVLDRVDLAGSSAKDGPKMRLSVWTNANSLRYTMTEEVRERGAYQYSKVLEVGSTREGESLAASGDSASSGPKCIVTGGAASMTLSYQGRTYPICCTGCRDAFNDDPEKYLKKASLMLSSQSGKTKTGQPASTRVGRFDDAFANDVGDTKRSDTPAEKSKGSPAEPSKKTEKSKIMTDAAATEAEKQTKAAAKKDGEPSAAAKKAARATTLLKLGQSLEKAGNTAGALGYFRQVVKDFTGTPAAKTAAERIKALE
jgi:YHS domain-containing protein